MQTVNERSGLAEVLRRPSSQAAQPKEYWSTIRSMLFPPELMAADLAAGDVPERKRPLPRPVGVLPKQAQTQEELCAAARTIAALASRAVSFKAPPGVGKSTIFPWEFYTHSKLPVVVASPTEQAAQAHVEEMRKMGMTATYVNPARMSVLPLTRDAGVYYTSVDGMVMRAFAAQRDMTDIATPISVVHDDCHEVDSAHYFFRSMWPDYTAIRKMVSISSVSVPEVYTMVDRNPRTASGTSMPTVFSVPFKAEVDVTLEDEQPDGMPAPWSIRGVLGKRTLMFVESDRIAAHLGASYGNFIRTFVLRRYHGFGDYLKITAALDNELGPGGALIIVDSAYQTGLKFPVEQIIDFGYVRHTVSGAGMQPIDQIVRETRVEQESRVNRATRLTELSDGPVSAYVPDEPVSNSAPGMGVGEVERVAALCALFGYEIPVDTYPRECADLFESADKYAFLSSGLPWVVWAKTAYVAKSPPKPPDIISGDTSRDSGTVDDMFDWLQQVKVAITPVSLKSGQFYSDSSGSIAVKQAVIDAIMAEYGDLTGWLRERIKCTGLRKLSDFSDMEANAIWLVWLTAWNWNVAELVALDKWRAEHGKVFEDWRTRHECRQNVAKLLATAKNIHDRWLLLSDWYKELFTVFPFMLKEIKSAEALVEDRHTNMIKMLGVGFDRLKLGTTQFKPVESGMSTGSRFREVGSQQPDINNAFVSYKRISDT